MGPIYFSQEKLFRIKPPCGKAKFLAARDSVLYGAATRTTLEANKSTEGYTAPNCEGCLTNLKASLFRGDVAVLLDEKEDGSGISISFNGKCECPQHRRQPTVTPAITS